MTYRYYIADPHWGGIKGTSDEKIARQFAADPDYFVVDTQMETQLACAPETHDTAIPEATDNS